MAQYVIVRMRDGTRKDFREDGGLRGKYELDVFYEPGFAVIRDKHGLKTCIPTDLIEEIEVAAPPRGW